MKLFLRILLILFSINAFSEKVYFINLKDGDELKSPFLIQFGLSGKGIAPAGTDVDNTGHHHLLINVDKLPDLKMPIPADSNHLHFGNGQTETEINLPEGKHTLQLLIGNHLHIPHNEPIISEKIEITVK